MPAFDYYAADCPACDWELLGASTEGEALDAAWRHYH